MWNVRKAKQKLLKLSKGHIKDDLVEEGNMIKDLVKNYKAASTPSKFFYAIKKVCWWDEDYIAQFMRSLL